MALKLVQNDENVLHLDGSYFFTGTPLIFLVPWMIAKYLYENQE